MNVSTTSQSLSFQAWDVTGTYSVDVKDMQPTLPVSAVADSLAKSMHLPDSIPWGIRAESSEFLDSTMPIGEALEPGSRVTVTPMTHLG